MLWNEPCKQYEVSWFSRSNCICGLSPISFGLTNLDFLGPFISFKPMLYLYGGPHISNVFK